MNEGATALPTTWPHKVVGRVLMRDQLERDIEEREVEAFCRNIGGYSRGSHFGEKILMRENPKSDVD